MKRYVHILKLVLLATHCGIAFAAEDFSRYSPILERRPFGAVSEAELESKNNVVTVVKPPAFVKDLRMCAITDSPAGLKVGFVNIRKKPPYPYYLYIGDSEDGIELVDANYENESALLRKGGEQFWMYMGATPAAGSPSTAKSTAAAKDSTARKRMAPGSQFSGSYAERRRKRLEEMRKRSEKARKLSKEEVEAKLQKYQMDLIRKGLTPQTPIKLTPEMDRQLVKEGVLPPIEE
jgi:hypothetical protein